MCFCLIRVSSSNPLTRNTPHHGKVWASMGVAGPIDLWVVGFSGSWRMRRSCPSRQAPSFQVAELVFHAVLMNQLKFFQTDNKVIQCVCLECVSFSFLLPLSFTLCVSIPSSLSLSVLFSLFSVSRFTVLIFSLAAFFLKHWYHLLTLSFGPLPAWTKSATVTSTLAVTLFPVLVRAL